MKPNNNSGFTLLEIIVSLAIMSLFSIILVTTFKQATDTVRTNKETSEMYLQAKSALEDISEHVQAATIFTATSTYHLISQDTLAYHTGSIADELYCVTKMDNDEDSTKKESELCELGYWLERPDSSNSYYNELKRMLTNENSTNWDFDFTTGSGDTIATQIVDLDFKFLQYNTTADDWQWIDEWDSRETFLNQTSNNDDDENLPRAIKATIWVIDEATAEKYKGNITNQKNNAEEMTTIIHLPESKKN